MININKMIEVVAQEIIEKVNLHNRLQNSNNKEDIGVYVNKTGSYNLSIEYSTGILFANDQPIMYSDCFDRAWNYDIGSINGFICALKYDIDSIFFDKDSLPSKEEIDEWKDIFSQSQKEKDIKSLKEMFFKASYDKDIKIFSSPAIEFKTFSNGAWKAIDYKSIARKNL